MSAVLDDPHLTAQRDASALMGSVTLSMPQVADTFQVLRRKGFDELGVAKKRIKLHDLA